MTKPIPERRAKLCSFRLEDENLASIDELALKQGVSRSQWIRQAVLAELVLELAGHGFHEVTHTEVTEPDLPDEPAVEELGDRPPPFHVEPIFQPPDLDTLRRAAERDEERLRRGGR
jgi:hypothetical protein